MRYNNMAVRIVLPIVIASTIYINIDAQTTKTTDKMAKIEVKERSEIADQYKWNVNDIFASDDAWAAKKAEMAEKMKKISSFKGKIGQSAKAMLEYFDFSSNLSREIAPLSIYAGLLKDQDLREAENIARIKELENLYIEMSQLSAYTTPELTAIPNETLDKYMEEEPRLKEVYGMKIDGIKRNKAHALSEIEEELIAKMSILGDVPSDTYDMLTDAEMPWPTITLENGDEVVLNQAAYSQVRASEVKADREKAFEAFWGTYRKFEGTMGELMNGNIKQHVFWAKVYKHESALAASLYGRNIPTSVYHSLVENVNKNLPTFHRYLKLKQKLMNLDELKYSDLYAPAVENCELAYTYEEAQQLILEAIKPLGKEYGETVARAFRERWIDVYPNKGKASGAYSNGGAYDVHPYILMNYNGQYESAGTLIHELGHTMHSYLSNKNQPFAKARYAIFVAEVASTFNEALLDDLMLNKLTDKKQKIALLMSMLDGFKGTLFRQTQFAEFELRMHEMAEKGEPITGKALTKLYGDIVKKYYGDAEGVCKVDDIVSIEWAFIPHFYRQFYVYQYSTSFVASQALAEKVLNGNESDRDRYLKFLSSGGSDYPINLLKEAGVDMTTSDPFDNAMKRMNALMDQIEALLK